MRFLLQLMLLVVLFGFTNSAYTMKSHLQSVGGGSPFSKEFRDAYEEARIETGKQQTTKLFVNLLPRFRKPEEQLELHLTIAYLYNQRTGLVDPAKAVEHFNEAMQYNLAEETFIRIMMLRGNSYERLGKLDYAMKDYLRGLIACSYHDLSHGKPKLQRPNTLLAIPFETEDEKAAGRDYLRYRKKIMFLELVHRQRYYYVEAVKRVQKMKGATVADVKKAMGALTPEAKRVATICGWIDAENKRPR